MLGGKCYIMSTISTLDGKRAARVKDVKLFTGYLIWLLVVLYSMKLLCVKV